MDVTTLQLFSDMGWVFGVLVLGYGLHRIGLLVPIVKSVFRINGYKKDIENITGQTMQRCSHEDIMKEMHAISDKISDKITESERRIVDQMGDMREDIGKLKTHAENNFNYTKSVNDALIKERERVDKIFRTRSTANIS